MKYLTTSAILLFLLSAMLWPQETSANTGLPSSPPNEAHGGSTDADLRIASPADTHTQPEPTRPPSSSETTSASVAESSQHVNDLRKDWLDHRERAVDWWLSATSLFLMLLSVLAVVAGYLGFKRFHEIETEARENVKLTKEYAEKAEDLVKDIQVQHELTAKTVQENPDEAQKAVERVQKSPRPSEIERAVATAVELQQRGSFEKSIEKWHALAITLEESDKAGAARAWFSVGYLRQKHYKNDLRAAIDAYSRAILMKPDLAEAYNNRGEAKSRIGHHAEAIADYGTAIQLKPDSAEAYSNRGHAKSRIGLHEEAITDCGKAIRIKPNLPEAYHNRGNAKSRIGRHSEAIEDYDEAIRMKPDFAEAYNNRGNAKNKVGRYEEAITDCGEAIRIEPDLFEAYANRGVAKDNLGRYAEAIKDYDETIRLKPDDARAHANRGIAKDRLGRREEAIADYDEAIRLKPDNAQTYANRGVAKDRLGRREEAIADCENAVRLARNSGDEATASLAEQILSGMRGAGP